LDLYVELRRLIEALDRAGVEYALAGGLAVSIYAAPRATEDIDVLVARADLERVIAATAPLGFREAGELIRVAGGRLEIQRLVKIEGRDLLPLDLLVPVDASLVALLAGRARIPWEGRQISLVDIEGLRTLKRLRGSAQDRADLEALGPAPE
jgi:hypothetical protein